jgi:hypothetical protein
MTHEEAVSTLASERYLLEEMSEPERETFEEHYFSCVECADDVRAAGVMRDGVRAGLMDERAVHTVHDMTASAWQRKNAGTPLVPSRPRFRGRRRRSRRCRGISGARAGPGPLDRPADGARAHHSCAREPGQEPRSRSRGIRPW